MGEIILMFTEFAQTLKDQVNLWTSQKTLTLNFVFQFQVSGSCLTETELSIKGAEALAQLVSISRQPNI